MPYRRLGKAAAHPRPEGEVGAPVRLLGALPPARESVRLPSPGVPSLGPAFECVEDDLLPSRRDSLPVPL